MKEAHIFEAWANRLVEGTWSTPDTPEKQAQLVELLSKEFPVGADATNATEQLYDLIGDDILFDQLETLADQNADADARQVVYNRLEELSDDPSIAEVLNQLNIDSDTPAETEDPADQISEDEDETSPVESAILRRVMTSHLDLLKQYGPAAVMAAARDVADNIGDVEEIGSSDVSAYVKRVVQSLDSGDFAHLEEQVNEEQLNEFLPALGAALGRAVAANAIGSMLDNDEEVDEAIPGNLPPDQIPGKDKLLKTPATKPQGVADKLKDVLGGIKDFVSGKPEDPSRPTYEADNLSTFEGKCNMTAEGEECPMHGLKECGMEENLDTDGIMMNKPSNMSSESADPMLARMKSLAGILAK
jgi:hypothetical protein